MASSAIESKAQYQQNARTAQHQDTKPGHQQEMNPKPIVDDPDYRPAKKLQGKVALITGGDSGIGQAVAVLYAKEGADVSIVYLNEHEDAQETKRLVELYGRRCELIPGDVTSEAFCQQAVDKTVQVFGRFDILVNNAAEHWECHDLLEMDMAKMERVFQTNVFAYIYLAKAALKYLGEGGSIINTASVVAYKGSEHLVDYSATKGAVVTFTRSLSQQLAKKKIRVNGIAPGPIWTPLIPSSFSPDDVKMFGDDVPLGRAGQPAEVATGYVYLASSDSSYMTGQVMHINGGTVVNA